MSDDYLWDRSGTPDPEIDELERTLAPLRYRPRPEQAPRPTARVPVWKWALAASILAALAGWQLSVQPEGPRTAWQVSQASGTSRLGNRDAAVSMAVHAGQLLRTGKNSGLTLTAEELGFLDVGPESELRAAGDERIRLQRGTLHAYIWAKPGRFVVDTPSVRAIDLGCEYTLTLNDAGNGLIRVQTGWVAFQFGGRESFIPAGAACATRKGRGPDLPYFEDASAGFRQAVTDYTGGDLRALPAVLAAARPRDGLTLWHLMGRVPLAERGEVFDRFAQLTNLPATVSRAGVLAGDTGAMDQCWDALQLGDVGWWRSWRQPWRQ